jgi:hypothetical protein
MRWIIDANFNLLSLAAFQAAFLVTRTTTKIIADRPS